MRFPRWTGVVVCLLIALTGCTVGGAGKAGSPGAGGATTARGVLDLPRVPWEGGADYWSRFSAAKASGWADPSFFPVGAWFDNVSTAEDIQYNKAHGFNTFVLGDTNAPYRLFADNGMSWIGGRLKDAPSEGADHWVGEFLDDEADGKFSAPEGQARLASLRATVPAARFAYANFTGLVINPNFTESDAIAYVNKYTDVVSVDYYWYTIPACDQHPYQVSVIRPILQATCRRSASYGAVMDMLRSRDATDGKLQPLWQFVEIFSGAGGEGPFVAAITPDQLRGAVMNSLIHEARGIVYFNQSLVGPCQSSDVIRMSQLRQGFCGAAQVAAAGTVNRQIHELAPVLNSQSYRYDFGRGLDTMLKVSGGNAYIFAMVDTTAPAGERRFTLPPGVSGHHAEVLFENRRVPVTGGQFKDDFAAEYTYHVYRVPLSGKG
jgi:hypothetical protein